MSERSYQGKDEILNNEKFPVTHTDEVSCESFSKRLTGDKLLTVFICLVLALACFAVYWPVHNYPFVNYDDQVYVTENQRILRGLTSDNIAWAFTHPHYYMWHPMTTLSNMLDYELFGLKPGRYHLTNLLFHIANTLLLFAILKRVTGRIWPSAFVAAVFALHPLNVESVAWISERKNVVSTFFWMLMIAAYVRYAKNPRISNYLLVFFVFALGLMSKPTVVTLPFVLFLLDYWPLCRFQWVTQDAPSGDYKKSSTLALVREKIPLSLLSAILCVITVIVQKSGNVLKSNEYFPFSVRLANALVSYVIYIGKMIYPAHLAVFYPHPGYGLPVWEPIVSFLALVAISVGIIYLSRYRPYLAVGWFWFLGTFVPVIGLVQAGGQAMADRYTYIPLVGLFIMIAWGVPELLSAWRYRKIIIGASMSAVILILAVCTRLQLRYWKDSTALWEHALTVTDNNFVAYAGLGATFCEQGKYDKGIEYLKRSLLIMPNNYTAQYNMGVVQSRQGKYREAVEHYREALRIQPGDLAAEKELASAVENQKKADQLFNYYDSATDLEKQGKLEEAVEYYNKVLELKPDFTVAHGRLGLVLARLSRIDEAIEQVRIVLKALPMDFEMHYNLGVLLERQGRVAEAIAEYRQALQIKPNYPEAEELLKAALRKQTKQ